MTQLSLRARIYGGFAIIVVLLIVNGFVSYSGLALLRDKVRLKQQVTAINTAALTIDRDVQELRLRVDRFVVTGHESLRDETGKIYARLKEEVESVDRHKPDARMRELLDRIRTHMEEYNGHFNAVVAERRVRQDLVQRQLPAQAEVVRARLSRVSETLDADQSSAAQRLTLSRGREFFAEADQSFLRYFDTPDTQLVNAAAASLASAEEYVAGLEAGETASEAIEAIRQYERTALRAVQATRSYMFFRNVVMAGEASEVSYYARALRSLTDELRDEISAQVIATGDQVNRITGATIAFALVLATLMAGRLALQIVPPITALTETFEKLSAGETLNEIPAATRQDEIGRMAEAAQVFSDQNRKTRELLDRTEALAQELKENAARLQATNDELDSFAYIASHDLKSPLRGIRQLATWIEEDSGDRLEGDSRLHLDQLKSRVQKMEMLLQDLLNYSRVGRVQPVIENVDVQDLVDGVIEITDNPAGVQVRRPDDLPTIATLRAPLEQVLLNLVGNAIKHNHRGAEGFVEIDWRIDGDRYRVAVRDNGPGIDAKDHARVFQMYQRVGDPNVDGSGMGLAIVKKQIEHLGGDLRLKSSLGEGATFEFTWPADASGVATESHAAAS